MAHFDEQHESVPKHTARGEHEHRGEADSRHGQDLAASLGNANMGQVLHTVGVQRAGATSAQHLDESVARAIEERRGRGRPLDDDTRTEMEDALGHDLSGVQVHTDSDAHGLNEAVGARAFTTGEDVFFKQGTYDPSSSSGRELLAHELTHVVQQRTGSSGLEGGQVSDPSDPAEQHAEAVGRTVGSGAAATSAGGDAPGGVSRQAEEEEELQMSREPGAVSRQAEEEEELQMSREPGAVSRQAEEEEEELQMSREPGAVSRAEDDELEGELA